MKLCEKVNSSIKNEKVSLVSGEQILKDMLSSKNDAKMVLVNLNMFYKPLFDMDKNLKTAMYNDFGFKFLRLVIDAIEKFDDCQVEEFSQSCGIVLAGLHICFTSEDNITSKNNEKILKLLFHILKQVYKRSSCSSALLISRCMLKQLLFFKSCTINDDVKKFLFTSHQMCYSLYLKNFKEGKLDSKLFKLRTYSLLILSYSNWVEYKFVEFSKDFLSQWMNVLYQKFIEIEFVLRTLKKFLYNTCLLFENVNDKLQKKSIIDLIWKIYTFTVRIIMINQINVSVIKFISVQILDSELIEYVNITEKFCLMSRSSSKTCCSLNLLQERQAFVLVFQKTLVNLKCTDWLLDIISVLNSYVKYSLCVERLLLLMDILSLFLLSSHFTSPYNDPAKVFILSLSLILQQVVKFVIPPTSSGSGDENVCAFKEDMNVRNELEKKLDSLVSLMVTKLNVFPLSRDERTWISNITHRLSTYLYGINKFKNALTLVHFSVILFEDEDEEYLLSCLNECYSKLNNLIGCYNKLNLFSESYKYSLKLLNLLLKVKNIEEKLELIQVQVENNVKIKTLLLQQNECSSKVQMCLYEELCGSHEQKDFWIEVFSMEFKALRRFGSKFDNGIVLKKLINLQLNFYEEHGDMLKYSQFLIELSTLPENTREERYHWCKEALGILEVMDNEVNCSDNVIDWHVKEILAYAYFQSSIIQYEQKILECNTSNIETVFQEEKELDEDLIEKNFVAALNTSVDILSEILSEQLSRSDEVMFLHADQAAQCLFQASILYSLLCQNFNAIKAAFFSGLLYEHLIACNKSVEENFKKLRAKSWSYVVLHLLNVNEVCLAELLLKKISSEELTNVKIAEAAVMIRNGKVDSSIEILNQVIDKHKLSTSPTSLLLKAEAYFMISCVKLSSHKNEVLCNSEVHVPVQSPFPPLKDCLKYLRSVYLASIENASDFSFVWEVLDKLITCLLHNAELFKQQGYIPQAKALLKEALLLSKKFHLSMRTINIIQQKASLDLILQNKVSFEKNFNTIKTFFKSSIQDCFNGLDLYLPDFVNHDVDCSCANCAYPILQEICIRLFLQYMESQRQWEKSDTPCEFPRVIEQVINNACFRFSNKLASIKDIMSYSINLSTTNKTKQNKLKSNGTELFSKYFAEAKIIQPIVEVKSNLADTVEKLIKQVQSCSLEKIQHEYCRIIAQLYCLRNLLLINESLISSTWKIPVKINNKVYSSQCNGEIECISKQTQSKTKTRASQKNIDYKTDASLNTVCEDEVVEKKLTRKLRSSKKCISVKKMKPESNLPVVKSSFDISLFLNDMEKSLQILNPYTDTLLIKSIYQLISIISGMQAKKLTLECELLHQSRTLHQQVLNCISTKDRRRKRLNKKHENQSYSTTCSLIEKYSAPDFVFREENLQTLVDEYIPADWIVANLSLSISKAQSFLIISRVAAFKSPAIVKINISSSNQEKETERDLICDLAAAFDEDLFESFDSILSNSKESMNIKNKSQWWNERLRLDKQMKNLVKRIEEEWLGGWKGMILGNFQDSKLNEEIDWLTDSIMINFKKDIGVEVDRDLLKILVDGYTTCSKAKIKDALIYLLQENSDRGMEIMTTIIEKKRKDDKNRLSSEDFKMRNLVVLVLDKDLQRLPWESIPMLRNQPVVRMPSLLFTAIHCMNNSVFLKGGLPCNNIYYIVNPSNDLKNTEIKFSEWFKSEGWNGIVGKIPTKDQFKSALEDNDLFIYCGHGSGQEYLGWDDIQQLDCRAVSLLMGCSSGKLQVHGYLEAYGMVLYYLLAGCPAVVANLWEVTDKDIDLFLEQLLKEWVTESSGESLASCVSQSRSSCNLEYLIGAAPVIYGLPFRVQSR
ncbi:uncharacterized protein LOC101239166 isoform X3 [Hydra vulgaris]|uniref:separase n=1 Tax=Hydra vulgaris TaxID=6087 RepID=A0ABM4CW01_HYDVU